MSLKSNNISPNRFEQYEISNNFFYKDYQPDLNILRNDINQYQLKEMIGEGMFGKVKLAIHLITNEKVAIKIFDKGKIKSSKESQYIEREISILKKLYHYNTIKLFNIIQNNDYIFLIQEYIPGKELLNYIEKNDNLSEKDICKIYQQLISGIEYMHEIGIAHRDLKLENILLNNKKDIKIIDFGLSNSYDKNSDELLHSSCGSPCYAAPEMIKGIEYRGINTDIWSSGIILYLMLCKSFPFNDKNNSKLYKKILSGKFNIPNNLSNEAKDLLINLLKVNPEERIKINEIKNHPWFNLINKSKNYFKGIDISKTILPIDEEIIREMRKFGIERNIIINSLLKNHFNNITTTYNLLLQKKIRSGQKSVADFCSDLYMNYIMDERNKFYFYNNDLDLIIKNKINENINIKVIPPINIEYGYNMTSFGNNNNSKYYNNNLLVKTFPKINTKSDEYTNRQISERQKEKNGIIFFPIKFRTLDHDSYSNSKKTQKMNKYIKNKTPNLTQFNTKKSNIIIINNINNINTIKNNGYSLNKYLEKLPTTNNYIKIKSNDLYNRLLTKKHFDKNYSKHNNNIPNYKQYVFNKSVDNKYSNEKYNGISNYNYYNKNNNKINKICQIRKKLKEPVEIKKNQNTIDEQSLNVKTKKDNSFFNVYNNMKTDLDKNNNKTFTQFFKTKLSKEKIKNKSNNKKPTPTNNNKNYLINNNNKNFKNVFNRINMINGYAADTIYNNSKRNNCLFEERQNKHKLLYSLSQQKDKCKDKKKNKKASSVSVDLNIRNQGKNDINIYTNKPKRKNVMKFINKNNNDLNCNYKLNNINNIYNKYGYCYKNELKRNLHNRSLDTNYNKY
jgi:5'-AMP-activated protein kinase catalytic alpha subunit